ncbi:MAG: molybdopterin-dependent oxidoreductase [Desulfobacca sp.]|uniref:molybdopterin-dependent oxidoreductase n=1 Tax=Desulfobacca sp. TaxID=2067990 RepID=UPI004048FE0C
MVNLTIDGKAIQAEEGSTVLQAAQAHGIRIPFLCYHPAIKAIGSCRICVVEVKPGPPRPQPACTTKVAEGMEVVTNSAKLQDIRRELVKFMLINHPLDCPWCDKGGECELQNLTHELGIAEVDYEAVRKPINNDADSKLIERYNTRCVTCGRCVRVCRERVGASAINFENRAYFTDLGSGQQPLNCEFCGTCIEVCPVGALINKLFKYSARAWEMTATPGICQFCGGGCDYEVHVKDGQVKRIRRDEGNPLLCVRGRFGFGVITSPERVKAPLIKKGTQFVEVGWDEALDFAAQGLMQVMAKGGPSAIYGIGSPRATNEANYVFQKFFRVVLGTNQLDNPARYNYWRALEGMAQVFGWPEIDGLNPEPQKYAKPFHSPLTLSEEAKGKGFPFVMGQTAKLKEADAVLVLGADVTPEMPPYGWALMEALQREDFRLIVANPRKTKYDRYAHNKLRYRPGSERALVLGLMAAMVAANPDIAPHLPAEGWAECKEILQGLPVDALAQQAGVAVADLQAVAAVLAQAQAPAIIFGNDLLAQASGRENALAVANLFLLIGQPCNPGSGLYPIAEKNNTHGVCDVGVVPNLLPGYQPLDKAEQFGQVWRKNLSTIPGLTLDEALTRLENNAVNAPQAFYILGGDLIRQLPNSQRVRSILQKARFIVYQGAFMTEVAKLADVILPVGVHAEVNGTYTNTDGRLGQTRAAVNANGVRPGWQIICSLSRKLDQPLEYASAEDIFKEMASLMPIYAGIKPGYAWPCPDLKVDIKGTFVPFSEAPEALGEGDFTLIVGKTMGHSGSFTTFAAGPMIVNGTQTLQLNAEDARRLGVAAGETVTVSSPQGRITVPVAVNDDLPSGVVFLADHFAEPLANSLTSNSNLCRVTIQKG